MMHRRYRRTSNQYRLLFRSKTIITHWNQLNNIYIQVTEKGKMSDRRVNSEYDVLFIFEKSERAV